MAFTHDATPPSGNLTRMDVALWFARARSGDDKPRKSARPDEDWMFDLEYSAAIVTRLPSDESMKDNPVRIGQRMYRPFFAAAAHIRAILYKLQSAGSTDFDDIQKAADALEVRQAGLDYQYGLRTGVVSGPGDSGSLSLERI